MLRRARIDIPGVLHHIIIRGIEGKVAFKDDANREDFIERLPSLLTETIKPCYARALMTNHRHLLLRTGSVYDHICYVPASDRLWGAFQSLFSYQNDTKRTRTRNKSTLQQFTLHHLDQW
jgi:hypothetical protein